MTNELKPFNQLTAKQQAAIQAAYKRGTLARASKSGDYCINWKLAEALEKLGWLRLLPGLYHENYELTHAGRRAYEARQQPAQPDAAPDTSPPDLEVDPLPKCFHLSLHFDLETNQVHCSRCGERFVPQAANAALAARVEVLETALRPFADQEKRLKGSWRFDAEQIPPFVAYYLTNGDIRRAADALRAPQAEEKE